MSNSGQNNEMAASPTFWAGETNAAVDALRAETLQRALVDKAMRESALRLANSQTTRSLPDVSLDGTRTNGNHPQPDSRGRKDADKSSESKRDSKSGDKSNGSDKMTKFDKELFTLINKWRTDHGLKELKFSSKLRDMAIANNKEMKRRGECGHFAFGGAEVAGKGYRTAKATLDGWLNSPKHKAILARRNLKSMGAAGDGKVETAHFA